MRHTLISIIILLFALACSQPQKSCVLIDNSSVKSLNPYKDKLDSLYQHPDSMEIFYIPQISPPKLYALGSIPNDTLYLTYTNDSGIFLTQKLWDYFSALDSTLTKGLKSTTFNVSVNWDGKLYYIEALDIKGYFNKKAWISAWKKIHAFPSKECGISKEYRFSQKVTYQSDK